MGYEQVSNPFEGTYVQAGQMCYDLIKKDKNAEPEFAFLIKEEQCFINRHKEKPIMELRTGLIKVNNVWYVPLMLLVNNDYEMLYETCFNYYQIGGGKQYIETLAKQDTITVYFYNEKNVNSRAIGMNNTIKDSFLEMGMRLSNATEWTMKDFDTAKIKMFETYPSMRYLWNKLSPIKGI